MTTLTGVSLKKRRAAALQYSRWRSAGEPHEITCEHAYELTGLDQYAGKPGNVRLTAVAIDYITKGGRR